jgi:hypothetical protein
MLKRQIIPSARADLNRIGQDYGIAQDVDAWCRQIVAEAHRRERPLTGLTEVPIEQVFDELETIVATPGSDWSRSVEEFRKAGWLEKLKALKVLITQRAPPWQLRVNSRVFQGLAGSVPVEVEAVYDINRVQRTVTFMRFEAYAPSPQGPGGVNQPQTW